MVSGSRKATALLASFLIASPALAEPKGAADKDKQLASELVKKAIAKSQAGDHGAAIEIYLQAYTIVPNSLLLSNIGAEFQQSGKPQEALRYFCMYLEKDPTGTNAVFATSQARSLQIQLGNKNVDDDDVCAKPQPRPVRKPARESTRESNRDSARESNRDSARESNRDSARESNRDSARESNRDSARESNRDSARTSVRESDRESSRDPDSSPRLPAEEDTPSAGSSTLKYVGLGAGALALVALGISAYDGIQAKNISDEITNHPQNTPWPDNIQDLQKQGQRAENYQIGALVVSGVLAATGVILYVVGRSDEAAKRSSDRTTLMVTPTANGLAVFGKF